MKNLQKVRVQRTERRNPQDLGLQSCLRSIHWQYKCETMVRTPGNREEQRRGAGLQSVSHPRAQLYFSRPLNKAMSVLATDSSLISRVSRSVAASWEDEGGRKNG